ncbi:bacillithiol biosynthesis deacetylase BshB2 [Bacillus carboniphilus]|uniref:Bacillithiol biosynthesis deacetylase BshB2 n=1 Tax=Bacillus carboniphilus TaxID=86663 RepID=A0ABY9JVD8_9BACI|nr:bacillithiol biosynthesis deacetylase BshB2 [Bacillus carboniphilus]WLR43345.1 bacillithiol biosynthesis deacetylase BshB2 [Bacillus carboniphilus]
MKENVLVILPHPDDEAFGVAGFITKKRKKGVPVTYACLTLGEMGRNFGKPPKANRETLKDLRKEELLKVAKILDLTELKMLGYRDKTIEFEDEDRLVNDLKTIIQQVNPTLVITFYPQFAIHPDHDATGEAVVKAVKQLPRENRPLLYGIAITRDTFDKLGYPDVVIDTNEELDVKIAALKAHQSQTETFLKPYMEKMKNGKIPRWFREEAFYVIDVE